MAPFQVHIHTVKGKEKSKSAIAAVYFITQKNIQNWTEHSLREQDIQTQIFFAGGEPPNSYNKRKKEIY